MVLEDKPVAGQGCDTPLRQLADVVFAFRRGGGGQRDPAAEQQFAATQQGSDVQHFAGVNPADRLRVGHGPFRVDQGISGGKGRVGEYFAEKH